MSYVKLTQDHVRIKNMNLKLTMYYNDKQTQFLQTPVIINIPILA